jgi:hypothetical protein
LSTHTDFAQINDNFAVLFFGAQNYFEFLNVFAGQKRSLMPGHMKIKKIVWKVLNLGVDDEYDYHFFTALVPDCGGIVYLDA